MMGAQDQLEEREERDMDMDTGMGTIMGMIASTEMGKAREGESGAQMPMRRCLRREMELGVAVVEATSKRRRCRMTFTMDRIRSFGAMML